MNTNERELAKTTKSGRIYEWKGDRFVSVTTALGMMPKPALNSWMLKQVALAAAKNRAEIAQIADEKEAQKRILDIHYSTPRNEAALLGSRIHKFAEWIAKSIDFEEQPEGSEVAYVDAFREFYADWTPEYIESEVTVFNRQHGYAGSADAIMSIDGKKYVVDIKSGKGVWPDAALQISAYRYAEFIARPYNGGEEPVPETDGGLVLHLTPTGYNLIPVDCGPEVFETFLSSLDIWRWQNIDKDGVLKEPWRKERG